MKLQFTKASTLALSKTAGVPLVRQANVSCMAELTHDILFIIMLSAKCHGINSLDGLFK